MDVTKTWLSSKAVLLSPLDYVLITRGKGWTAVGLLVTTGTRGLRAVAISCMQAVCIGLMVVQQILQPIMLHRQHSTGYACDSIVRI